MASSLFPDPLKLWRDAVTKLENDVNSLATGSLRSREVVRSLHQFSTLSQGMQQMLDKVIDGHLRRANLPSRREVAVLAESLQRIEDKLDRLLPADTAAPRPARTRRPPSAAPVQEIAATAAPAKTPRRPARRGKG